MRPPMGLFFRFFSRPVYAILGSERSHNFALKSLKFITYLPFSKSILSLIYKPKKLPLHYFGMDFPNPLGLAAGMDKKGEALSGWESLGFGFIEMGGITSDAQPGNPKPRMFRSHRNQALVNRMGFNNPGREATAKRLAKLFQSRRPIQVPLFINLGKSKATPLENAHEDYAQTVSSLNEFADAFVINVSSPNTPGLRSLQSPEQLKKVIDAGQIANVKNVPMLVKISPDLADDSIIEIVDTARECGCAGIIATNTTLTRPNEDKPFDESGGLSGKPLRKRSTEVIRLIAEHTNGEWPIIGVGGISTADDAWEKITHGAWLVQIYSAMVFHGPSVIKKINTGLQRRLKEEGLTSLDQAIGAALR